MNPLLIEGDLVELEPLTRKPLPGEVYAFSLGMDQLVVHRCINSDENIFKGDNQPYSEKINEIFYFVPRLLDRKQNITCTQIVMGICGLSLQKIPIEKIKNISLGWDWAQLILTAQQHRLLPLFIYSLKKCKIWDQVPENHKTQLLDVWAKDQFRCELIEETIKDLNISFPYTFLKGVILRNLYPNPTLRPMNDIDILVEEKNYFAVLLELEEKGFIFTSSNKEIAKYYHQATVKHEKTNIPIEVHKNIFQKYRYSFTQIKSQEETIAYISAHAITHWGMHGLSLIDLNLLLQNPYAEEELWKTALHTKSLLALFFCMEACKYYWNLPINIPYQFLKRNQKIRFFLAKELCLWKENINMFGFRKKILQFLLSDNGMDFFRMFFDPARIKLSKNS